MIAERAGGNPSGAGVQGPRRVAVAAQPPAPPVTLPGVRPGLRARLGRLVLAVGRGEAAQEAPRVRVAGNKSVRDVLSVPCGAVDTGGSAGGIATVVEVGCGWTGHVGVLPGWWGPVSAACVLEVDRPGGVLAAVAGHGDGLGGGQGAGARGAAAAWAQGVEQAVPAGAGVSAVGHSARVSGSGRVGAGFPYAFVVVLGVPGGVVHQQLAWPVWWYRVAVCWAWGPVQCGSSVQVICLLACQVAVPVQCQRWGCPVAAAHLWS